MGHPMYGLNLFGHGPTRLKGNSVVPSLRQAQGRLFGLHSSLRQSGTHLSPLRGRRWGTRFVAVRSNVGHPRESDLHFLGYTLGIDIALALMNNLERIPVRVEDVCGVVSRIVFDSRSRRDIVLRPGCHCGSIEVINLRVALGLEPPMD